MRLWSSVLVLLSVLVAVASASSDLTPAIYDAHFVVDDPTIAPGDVAEGCAGGTTGRTLLRFGTRVTNLGPDALEIGEPGCPDCTANPGAACQNPLFVCAPGSYRVHFRSAAQFELLDPSGARVLVGGKRGYCFNDDACSNGATPVYTTCDAVQGLSVDCVDDYEPFLDCQYLDVTDVPDVTTRAFRLRVTIDTLDLLPDPDRTNNVAEMALPGCGDGIVQDGEECDPGPGAGSGCCDAHCHLSAAGTTCRPAAGPCDVAEVCDGASPQCPADVAAAAACAIDGACVAAGAANPADGCQRCDPRTPDRWSPDVSPDPDGVRCQLARLTAAVGAEACGPRVARRLAAPLRRLRHAVDRELSTAVTGRPARRSVRLGHHLATEVARAGRRPGCDVGPAAAEVAVLLTQLEAMTTR